MAESLIISVSGMRGVIGENLTPVIAAQYGCAFGTFLRDVVTGEDRRLRVCVGRDSRVSGQMLLSAMTAGLCSVGVDVIDLGLVTTPCVGIMLRELGCDGGIVITASHNPLPYNGIKLLLSNGMAPPAPTAAKIKQAFLDGKARYVDSVHCGTVSRNDDTDRVHVNKVLATIEARRIKARRYRIVLDSVNGAGARVAKKLLMELGCEVIAMNDEPSGLFAHGAEPIAANLGDLCRRVQQEKADLGFAQDPDADRLAIVDENGVYIGEEYTLALAAKHVFSKQGGTAAANLSTSRMIDDIAARVGARVLRTPVGEAHVANAMIEHGCVIGGEGNGGVIDLRVGPIRDSLVGMALVLQLMAETGKSISGLVAEIGGYSMHKDKFAADSQQAQEIMKRAARRFPNAVANTADGLRLDLPDAWIHLRTSNTEPVMRIIVEAKDELAAMRYVQAVSEIRQAVLETPPG
ncbi:MAG TPA: phosphoglucosamine mutase [Sedimentisphaerales bacterium]|nr:phosphoglucosamine mutase [Phycisphaerae bacterium]HON93334.1 phosphoglucosamine mutase [Sedimentisphaerales bacterium]HQI27068.1 phosphoglucosamine mutase [Sedimentisphaerales bacterium]